MKYVTTIPKLSDYTHSLLTTPLDYENAQRLIELMSIAPFWQSVFTKDKYRYLGDWLNSLTPKLQGADYHYNWYTKFYWVLNGLTDFPLCRYCNKVKLIGKDINSFDQGYFRACTHKCVGMLKEKKAKIEQTVLNRYGSKSYFSSDAGKARMKEWLESQGVTNTFQLESVKKASCEARKRNFGYEYTMQSPEKRLLASKNYFEKTGYEHQFKNPEIIKKTADTLQKKHNAGIDVYALRRVNNRKKRYEQLCLCKEVIPNFSYDVFKELDECTQYTTLLNWHCNECGNDFDAYLDQNLITRQRLSARCMTCHPYMHDGVSNEERNLVEFIRENVSAEVLQSDRKIIAPLELDCVIPSKHLAIEYDGLYWHRNDDSRHLQKTLLCENAGYQLIHVFENEWLTKKEIVKSRFRNLLGVYDRTLYARKCVIKDVDSKTSKSFQEQNHIQGAVHASISLGLFYDDELVSIMTFGKTRFSKKYEWEMLRFCSKLNYHVVGAAGKLLSYFEKMYQPKSLVSYADRRWSQGKVYKALGFTLDHISAPNYWYFKNCSLQLESRVKYQKHRLAKILPRYDARLTEIENMHNNGYHHIYDCGNLVFSKLY